MATICESKIALIVFRRQNRSIVACSSVFHRKSSHLSYYHQTSKEPLTYQTISQMVSAAVTKYGNREALVDCTQGVRLTFEEANKRAENFALGLLELGFKPNDRIGIWGPNSVQWYIASLAASKAGLIIVDINPGYQSSELLYCIQAVKLKGIIMDETFKTQHYLNILNQAVPDLTNSGPNTPVKSATLPYFTHVIVNSSQKHDGVYRFQDIEHEYSNKKHHSSLLDIDKQCQADDGCLIQFTSGTTGSPKAALLSHFNVVNNGLLAAKRQNLNKMWLLICQQQVYGMTETSPVTFLHPAENELSANKAHTVGKVLEHTEVKVVDSENRMVPLGQQGELLVRGYCNMLRYWGNEEKTKEMISEDGWLRTGDQFVLTEDGFGQVVGRLKDLIIRGGENIYPGEVEDFLTNHPDILEAYVYGVRDERMGEEIGASIRLQDNCSLSEADLREYCKGKISHFKVPRYIEFVQDFPKTTSGKIRKFILKENMEKRLMNV
uniref:Medium-chain acyl-CoA ligase ACSF2, mitochondrial n=1 Tax=Cacopsylla melanoneura TaxID=428564 RepID=A0A8D8VFM1_9HEMI